MQPVVLANIATLQPKHAKPDAPRMRLVAQASTVIVEATCVNRAAIKMLTVAKAVTATSTTTPASKAVAPTHSVRRAKSV